MEDRGGERAEGRGGSMCGNVTVTGSVFRRILSKIAGGGGGKFRGMEERKG